jgi:hypothetical protein
VLTDSAFLVSACDRGNGCSLRGRAGRNLIRIDQVAGAARGFNPVVDPMKRRRPMMRRLAAAVL